MYKLSALLYYKIILTEVLFKKSCFDSRSNDFLVVFGSLSLVSMKK